jgi:hypothetical protein
MSEDERSAMDIALDETYKSYESDHSMEWVRHIHPMFRNGTFTEDNSYIPPKPEKKLTKEEFIKSLEETDSEWAFAVQVLYSYILREDKEK